MKEGGRIATIGGVSGQRAAAVAMLVRGAALDLAARGITVNNIQPGPIETDMNAPDQPHVPHVRAMMPVKRLGRPEEEASMVAYLTGAEASFITGSSFTVDGGYSA